MFTTIKFRVLPAVESRRCWGSCPQFQLSCTARSGFALVEVLVALVLFAFGAMAVVSSTAVLTRAATSATRGIELSRIAKSRTELLASLSCSSRQSGAETVQKYEEEWTVLPGAPGTVVARVRVFSPADSSAVEHEVVLPC